ncbi:MAG: acireductone synthase [Bacteroidia bacterium]|nr:acireductone synthase [Bacteroidia bacterium]MDW8334084.1 acireductone synthase [Bacteroidia bacterium]
MFDYVLTDIEGTTSPIHFVKNVLFPYAKERMYDFLVEHRGEPEVARCVDEVHAGAPLEVVVDILHRWTDEDVKAPPLKKLQGLIWAQGYESGALVTPLYPDVPPALERWSAEGKRVGVYSSGSVQAQKMFYRYTEYGDLSHRFSHFFDTEVGHKRQTDSYRRILQALSLPPDKVMFLSDVPEELMAAQAVGIKVGHIVRDGVQPSPLFRPIYSFASI